MKHPLLPTWVLGLTLLAGTSSIAAEESVIPDQWRAPVHPTWTNIISTVLTSETRCGLLPNTIAPPVAVDRTTGRVYIYGQGDGYGNGNSGNGGLLMTSTDAGNIFDVPKQPFKPNDGWGFIYYSPISVSPDGNRLAIFAMDGGVSRDGGTTWSVFSRGPKWGLEQAAVNWRENDVSVLAREHSCDGLNKIFLSLDSGRTWNDLGNTYSATALGLLPTDTIVTQQEPEWGKDPLPVNRSDDHGATWTTQPAPQITTADGTKRGVQFVYSVVVFKKIPYWLSNSGVFTTSDDGKTWSMVGNPFPDTMAGTDHLPVHSLLFGKDEHHLLVMLSDQFIETVDGGEHWHSLMPTPQKVLSTYACAFAGYDPIRDILYFSMRHAADAHDWVHNHIYRAELRRETGTAP